MRSSITAALLRKRFRGGAGNGLSISAPASLTFDDADQPISLYDYEAHNLLANSDLNGAVAGTPGTAPTGWSALAADGTVGTITDDGSGNYVIPLSVTGGRHYFIDAVSVISGEIYEVTATVTVTSGTITYNQILTLSDFSDLDSYYTMYLDDGVPVSAGSPCPAGTSVLTLRFRPQTDTSGNVRLGIGTSSGPQTAVLSITKPFLQRVSAPRTYVQTTGTAGTPVASYGDIQFADSKFDSGADGYRLQVSIGGGGDLTAASGYRNGDPILANAYTVGDGTADVTFTTGTEALKVINSLLRGLSIDNLAGETVSLTGTFTHVATGRSKSFSITVTSNAASGFIPSRDFSDARNTIYVVI